LNSPRKISGNGRENDDVILWQDPRASDRDERWKFEYGEEVWKIRAKETRGQLRTGHMSASRRRIKMAARRRRVPEKTPGVVATSTINQENQTRFVANIDVEMTQQIFKK
ncbi:hypothetical protein GWI33_013331, partial [Rhynchophorus ferrugineus]